MIDVLKSISEHTTQQTDMLFNYSEEPLRRPPGKGHPATPIYQGTL